MNLELQQITVYYGQSQALFGVSLQIAAGQAVTLLGRNGMGKTTTVNAIMGNLRCAGGEIHYGEHRISQLPRYQIPRLGIAVVPEGRQVFPNLNVRENLQSTAANYGSAAATELWNLERVLELFPQLKPRLGHFGAQLSGGEAQMVAIARALMLNPSLLILDEASEGLAPLVRQELWQKLRQIKSSGIALLLIDKHWTQLGEIADCHYLIQKGSIVWHGDTASLNAQPKLRQQYLGI